MKRLFFSLLLSLLPLVVLSAVPARGVYIHSKVIDPVGDVFWITPDGEYWKYPDPPGYCNEGFSLGPEKYEGQCSVSSREYVPGGNPSIIEHRETIHLGAFYDCNDILGWVYLDYKGCTSPCNAGQYYSGKYGVMSKSNCQTCPKGAIWINSDASFPGMRGCVCPDGLEPVDGGCLEENKCEQKQTSINRFF